MADAPRFPDQLAPAPDAGLDTEFTRGLGLFDATMVVVGSMIGSGIFILTGTAAEVVPIGSVDDRVVGDGVPGPITKAVQATYFKAVRGGLPQYESWLTRV